MEDYDWEIPRGELYFSGIQITENGALITTTTTTNTGTIVTTYRDDTYVDENGKTITMPVNMRDNTIQVDALAMEALMDLAGFKKVGKK